MTTILLVEDDPHQRLLYRLELEDAGFEVVLASSGSDAIGLARQELPHLVVVNPNLSDMKFEVFIRVLQNLSQDLIVVVHSGDAQQELACRNITDGFVLKSSDLLPLRNKIGSLLKKKETQQIV